MTSPVTVPPASADAPLVLDFGPYVSHEVAFVAVADPGYLLDLVREGVGSDTLRAEAARELARRARLVPPGEPWPMRVAPPDAALPLAAAALPARWIATAPPHQPLADASPPGARSIRLFAGSVLVATAVWLARWLAAARPWQLMFAVTGVLAALLVVGGRRPWAGGADDAMVPSPPSLPTPALAVLAELPARSGAAAGRSPTGEALLGAPATTAAVTDARAGSPAPCGARVPGAIPAESATDYLDTFQAVEFEVVQAKDTGRVTFLNSRIPYAGAFYVAIFPDDYAAFPEPPATYLTGRCIVVQGTIEIYRGAPQIVLRHPDDLRLVEAPAPGSSNVSDAEPAEPAQPAVAQPTPPRAGPGTPRAAR